MCDMNAVETHVRTLVLANGSGGGGNSADGFSGLLAFAGSLSATWLPLAGLLLLAGGLAAGLLLRARRESGAARTGNSPPLSGSLATSE